MGSFGLVPAVVVRRVALLIAVVIVMLAAAGPKASGALASYEFERTWEVTTANGVAVDPQGNVYVTDENVVKKFTNNGTLIKTWGGLGSAAGELNDPQGISIGPQGQVYVADYLNYRVQEFTTDGTFIREWPVKGPGGADVAPFDVDTDPQGNVYIVQAGSTVFGEIPAVQRYTATGA
ncbi:MAG: SBBP repeat-containing protein, partial [Solirubrobacterales bacterium]